MIEPRISHSLYKLIIHFITGIPQNNRYSSDDTDDNEEENSKFANKVFEL